jgi:hypothetical protein
VRKLPLRKPSAAMTVAIVALFVALGGTSVATVLITGANIKNGTVASLDLKNNDVRGIDVKNGSLTGADILESKLSTVPSATHAALADRASSADAAGTAQSVNGSKIFKVNQTVAVSAAPVTVFSAGGLNIVMDCAPGTKIALRATTTVGGATIASAGVGNSANDNDSARDLTSGQTVNGNFNPAGGGGTNTFDLSAQSGDGFETSVFFTYYNPSSSIITGQLYVDEASGCQAHGNITTS